MTSPDNKSTQPLPIANWRFSRQLSKTLPPPSMRHTARSTAATVQIPLFGGDEAR